MAKTDNPLHAHFSWKGGIGSGEIEARVTLTCLRQHAVPVGCRKHHSFKFDLVLDDIDDELYLGRETPQITACFGCGNAAGLTKEMLKQVLELAKQWVKPQMERLAGKKENENELLRSLWDIIWNSQKNEDIAEAFDYYEFNLVAMYYQLAGADLNSFAELVSGDWGSAIIANAHLSDKPPLSAEVPSNRNTVSLLNPSLNDTTRRHALKLLMEWRSHSAGFTKPVISFSRAHDWFYQHNMSMFLEESRWLLAQLADWRVYREYSQDREFRIVPVQKRKGTYFYLETRPITSPRS